MTLAPGETLGPYRIEHEIGRGGMGVVHQARDSRLDRAVAVKALPEGFATDPERLARFEREARLLAALHHPNVAGIYGLEEHAGHRYLILELVEGVTLAERLEHGPLPVDEALDVCRQIALALEAAHEAGIVHRDLKPGNVKLTPAGDVKVLDFGLAKGPASSAAPSSSDDLSRSPTMTLAATGMGVILGTAAYMSPEQARGRVVDRRTDIWSFGAVLYECLTGRQCFAGETVSDMIARILQGEPDWKALPAATPASVRNLLHRCLEKDPKQRLRDIGDARLDLETAIAALKSGERPAPAPLPPVTRARWIAGGVLAGAALGVGVFALILALRGTKAERVVRFPVELPPALRVAIGGVPLTGDWAVSNDGTWFAARVWPRNESPTRQTGPRMYVHSLAESEWRPVAGSELAIGRPVFSPDGRYVYFASQVTAESNDTRILRTAVRDPEPAVALYDAPPDNIGGLGAPGNRSVFVHFSGRRFMIVTAGERSPRAWRDVKAGSFGGAMDVGPAAYATPVSHDQVFMGTTEYSSDGWHRGTAVLDLRTGTLTPVLRDGQFPTLLPSGHLLFARGQTIFATRFDRGSLKVKGEAVPVFEGIRARGAWVPGAFRVTDRGDLVYAAGGLVGERRELAIIDLSGRVVPVGADARAYNSTPAVSQDGRWMAVAATNARGIDEIWRIDTSDHSSQKLAGVPDADLNGALMSPDGSRIAFTRLGATGNGIYGMPVAGDEDPQPIVLGGNSTDSVWFAAGWFPGRERMLAVLTGATHGQYFSIEARPTDATHQTPKPVLQTIPSLGGTISWDGRWDAIQSDRAGRSQFYVAPLFADGTAGKPVLASPSGTNAGWSADNSRLYVQDSTKVKMVRLANGVPIGPPVVLYDLGTLPERATALAFLPDGRAVATLRSTDETELTRIEVIQNWVSTIRAKLP